MLDEATIIKALNESAQSNRDMAVTIKRLESIPAGRTQPKDVFGGFQPAQPGWPVERLKNLEPYGFSHLSLMSGKNGPRISGVGPALVKLACMSGNQNAITIAKSQGLWEDGYGAEQFEKQYGYVGMAKAAREGIPWAKMGGSNEVRKTALAESSGFTGGYIVPPQFQNELLTIAAEDSFIEPRAKVVPMNTRTVQWPVLDITTAQASGVSPYFGGVVGTWQPEAQSITETEPAFRQADWTAWDLELFMLASNQLLADNGIGLDAFITQMIGKAMTFYKTLAFLQGKGAGASMPLGVLNAPATFVQNRSVPNTFKLADAAAMMSHLQYHSWEEACWIMHYSVLPQLIQMVDNSSSNRLVWMSPMGDAKSMGPAAMKLPTAFLNSLPVFFTEALPQLGTKGDVMLVDWSKYVIGMRLDLQLDVSSHVAFRSNQLAWRAICRLDGKPFLSNVITDQSGYQSSPLVCLN